MKKKIEIECCGECSMPASGAPDETQTVCKNKLCKYCHESEFLQGQKYQWKIMKEDLDKTLTLKIEEMEAKDMGEMLDSEAGFIAGLKWILKKMN